MLFLLFGLGILFRLTHYLENRSLWEDEAWRALWVGAQSYSDIIFNKPFATDLPVPPAGFLLLGKISTQIFGNNEFALRLFPLIFGMTNLFLFYTVLKSCVSSKARGVAFGLAIFLDSFIYFSAEFKQYSQDVFVALAMYFIFYHFRARPFNVVKRVALGVSGALAILFSHTAVFILAAIGIVLICESRVNPEKGKAAKSLLIILGYWAASFIYCYKVIFEGMLSNQIQTDMVWQYFWPHPAWSWESLRWLVNSWIGLFQDPLNFLVPWVAAILTFLGMAAMWRQNKENFFLFVFPMILVLLASSLKAYPFHGRWLLFMVPNLLLFLAVGVETIFMKKSVVRQSIYGIAIIILFFTPVTSAFEKSIQGRGFEQMRPLMTVLKAQARPSDKIYVNSEGHFAFFYYLGYFRMRDYFEELGKFSNFVQTDSQGEYVGISYQKAHFFANGCYKGFSFLGRSLVYSNSPEGFGTSARTWVLFSHWKSSELFVLDFLDRHGRRLGEWQQKGSSLYLYDLSPI